MKKCRLIYKSLAKSGLVENHGIQNLAKDAEVRNKEYGITGLLLLTGDQVLQVLEGPGRFVNQLYRNIVNDPRHSDVELISYESVDAPLFVDWSMRFMDLRKLPPHVHALMLKKYPHKDDTITIPNSIINTLALLIDARNLGLET